jgi:hypothetical protein
MAAPLKFAEKSLLRSAFLFSNWLGENLFVGIFMRMVKPAIIRIVQHHKWPQ